jgi:fucose permease
MDGDNIAGERKKQKWFVTLFFLFSGVIAATWSSRIPAIQSKLGLTNAALGTVLFAVPVGLATGLSFSSWAIVRFGSRSMMLLSSLLAAAVLALAGLANSPILLMIVLFFLGISRTLLNLSANTAALEVQQWYDRPVIARFHGMWSLACFAAAGVSAVIIAFDIRPAFHFITVAFVLVATTLLLIKKQNGGNHTVERRPFFVMPDHYLFLLGLMALCAMLCEGAMFDWSVNYFEKVVGVKKSMVMTGYICFMVAMAAGRLTGDRFIHAFGVHRMLVACGSLLAAGFFVAASFPNFITAAIGFLLIGMGDSILVPAIYMLASKSTKMPTSYALSSVTLIGYTGFIISPLLIGNVSQHWGMPAAFAILGGVSLLLIVLTIQVKKKTFV